MTALIEPTDRQLCRIPLGDPEVGNQLHYRVRDLARRHEMIFGLVARSALEILRDTDERTDRLGRLLRADVGADQVALTIMSSLVGRAEAESVEFWETALGRVLALRGAYPKPDMPRTVAAAILNVTRQRVSQMVDAGLLAQGRGGFVTNASLVRLLAPA